ncbi:MAG: endonuclease/exonuclease/phosphatase family protein [Pseudomonadota bacterium]
MLKVLTLNVWNYEGPWEQRLALIRRWLTLLSPDLVGFQEILQGADYNQADELLAGFGYHTEYAGPMNYWNDPSLQFGNLVASRWPISEAESVLLPMAGKEDQRVLVATTIDSPHGPLCFNTTHLSAQSHHGYIREQQVRKIVEVILRRRQRGTFPPILCGDFNAVPDSTEMRYLRGLQSLEGTSAYFVDAWQMMHGDQAGHTFARDNPYLGDRITQSRRIDYILVGKPDGRTGRVQSCDLACHLPADGVFPSDHFGLYAELSTD